MYIQCLYRYMCRSTPVFSSRPFTPQRHAGITNVEGTRCRFSQKSFCWLPASTTQSRKLYNSATLKLQFLGRVSAF